MDLNAKVALVTGAGRRIGRAIALQLASHGAIVAVHYRTSHADADAVVAEISATGRTARTFRANLENVTEIETIVTDVLAAFGRIDVLVHSASIFNLTP